MNTTLAQALREPCVFLWLHNKSGEDYMAEIEDMSFSGNEIAIICKNLKLIELNLPQDVLTGSKDRGCWHVIKEWGNYLLRFEACGMVECNDRFKKIRAKATSEYLMFSNDQSILDAEYKKCKTPPK